VVQKDLPRVPKNIKWELRVPLPYNCISRIARCPSKICWEKLERDTKSLSTFSISGD